jgi:hypothetical protein
VESGSVLTERTSVIRLEGDVARVFPLFGPLREREWAEGWNPTIVWPTDEVVLERMVFLVRSAHGDARETMWVVSRYDEARALVEYIVFEPESVHWIRIRCRSAEDENGTEAAVTYTYVGTTESARRRNARALASMYRHDLKDWETAINHYLRTGERLSHHP